MNEIMGAGAHGGDPTPVPDKLTQLVRLHIPGEPGPSSEKKGSLASPLLNKLLPPEYSRKRSSFNLSEDVIKGLKIAAKIIRDHLPAGSKMHITK
ncbi:MAG: hypothetical protein ABFS09_05150 [Thermodesulfobacteriota bacterium]